MYKLVHTFTCNKNTYLHIDSQLESLQSMSVGIRSAHVHIKMSE